MKINNELDELRNALIDKDKPLLLKVLKASIIDEYNLKNAKLINCYLCNINMRQYCELTYEDSDM